MIKRTRLMRKLHAELKELGISRELFKKRIGVTTMIDLSDKELCSKIRFLTWVRRQDWPTRRLYGATR